MKNPELSAFPFLLSSDPYLIVGWDPKIIPNKRFFFNKLQEAKQKCIVLKKGNSLR